MTTNPDPYDIRQIVAECYQTALEHGWWDDPNCNTPEKIALMHSELSEALEYYRQYGMRQTQAAPEPFSHMIEEAGYLFYQTPDGDDVATLSCNYDEGDPHNGKLNKPEGMAAEFADVIVRIFDLCGRFDIPIVQALLEKMAYNKTRPYRHGNKKA